MRNLVLRSVRSGVAALAFFMVPSASAEPIRITGGSIFWSGHHDVDMVGSVTLDGLGRLTWRDSCEVCNIFPFRLPVLTAGTPVDFSTDFRSRGGGPFQGRDASVLLTGRFTSTSGVAVPTPDVGFFSASAPFTMEGFLIVSLAGATLFEAPIIGAGTARYLGSSHPSDFDFLQYTFEDPGAVPEPATLTLLATGLLAGALHRRVRRASR